jgi:polysaccharide chain length determinant protein (PEP-CTERM system associated)
MLPGKQYTPDDVLLILKRRVWFVLVPFAIVSAGAAVYVRRLPDLYRSEAVIMVVPPRVPAGLVAGAAPTKLEDRLPAIEQQVTSRTRLERIILDLDLYPVDRRTMIMEDIVEKVRNNISVDIVRGDAFRVSYVGEDPRTVMKVADRVSTLLIDESTRDRELLMEGTDQFLEAQLEDARRRLVEHEQKFADYRRRFAGELPTQVDSNLQTAQTLQSQVQALTTALDRDQERRLLLERQLADLESAAPDAQSAPVTADGGSTQQQLSAARKQLADMQLSLKEDHPDVQRMKRVIRDLEAKLEADELAAPISAAGGRGLSPAEQTRQRRIADLRDQIAQLDKQTARNTEQVKAIREGAEGYLKRAEAGPTRETEMVELNRDYQTLQGLYTSLLAKKEDANIAANLERRQIGQQFKILDQARLPARPFSPNRQRFNLMGMALGLAVGLALVAWLEYRIVSFATDDEVSGVLGLPVLAVVPVMQSDGERRRRKRLRLIMGACLSGTVAGCLALLTYTFLW